MKRSLDLFLSIISLIFLLPIFVITIPILLLTGEHKVFYLQERVGYRNTRFKIIKFATMVSNSPNIGTGSLTLKNDPRVLPFGRILRKTKINELPQIFNVIVGDMSLVGPRPQMEVDFCKYSDEVQSKIYNVKPGITGIASIIFRDEESILTNSGYSDPHEFYKNVISPYKGEIELWYQNNYSLKLDLKIIIVTILIVLFPNLNYTKFFSKLPKAPF